MPKNYGRTDGLPVLQIEQRNVSNSNRVTLGRRMRGVRMLMLKLESAAGQTVDPHDRPPAILAVAHLDDLTPPFQGGDVPAHHLLTGALAG